MNQTFNLLFSVRKAKANYQGEAPIYLRITINGKVSEISKRAVKPI
ncbi:Arm DNA-binding domain-containing protein [uncultured Chryseobacterium sp.]|nr:Arm DNA-binding domain-containing protein [uncultured Chryseobacterium sp.]